MNSIFLCGMANEAALKINESAQKIKAPVSFHQEGSLPCLSVILPITFPQFDVTVQQSRCGTGCSSLAACTSPCHLFAFLTSAAEAIKIVLNNSVYFSLG